MTPFFSIIIPVYNAQVFLCRCIDSILNQSFADFELLLVDDGSTDDSGAICNSYADKDNRVRVFHKNNGGVSEARNWGLDNAKGQWILFVDADDYLINDTCMDTLSKTILAQRDCELLYYAGQVVSRDDSYKDTLDARLYDFGYHCMEDNCIKRKYIVFGSVYVQCFKKSVVDTNHLRFDESILYSEDRLFVCSYYLVAGKTIVIPDVIYCYVVNENSLMHDENKKKRLDCDQRKSSKLIEGKMRETKRDLPHLRKYIHGLYVHSVHELPRNEIDWSFLFRNASTIKLLVKDFLLYLGLNKYKSNSVK